jgi:hypothetical protein
MYVVPSDVVRKTVKRTVQAWKSSVPGLIVQRPLDPEQKWFHITHAPSGCILKNYVPTIEKGFEIINRIRHLDIKWDGKATDVYESIAKLSRKDALAFYKFVGLGTDRDHRKANLHRSRNHRREMKKWKGRR